MAEDEGTAKADALLAALTDEPLPDEALDDPEFMAEHRSATADVAALREQLAIIGAALSELPELPELPEQAVLPEQPEQPTVPSPRPSRQSPPSRQSRAPTASRPSRSPRPRRRPFVVVFGTLAAAAVASVVVGMGWLLVQAGGMASDAGSTSDSAAEAQHDGKSTYSREMHIACSKVLVEGTVRSITPGDDGNVRVVLDVTRYYRPERSVGDHPTITVTLRDSARADLRVGVRTLVRVPVYPQDRQDWETGWGVGDARKDLLDALPGARGLECAGPQRSRG